MLIICRRVVMPLAATNLPAEAISHRNITRPGRIPGGVAWVSFVRIPMNLTLTHVRPRQRRIERIDNPMLSTALRRGKVRCADATLLPAQAEQAGAYRGYYMRTGDGHNHWLGESLQTARANFARAADLFLNRHNGYDYEMEFSHGQVTGEGPAWDNVDCTGLFI